MAKTLREQIADRIRTVLKEKEWRQQDLVNATGFTKSYISLVLSAEKNLTLETIEVIQTALKSKIIDIPK